VAVRKNKQRLIDEIAAETGISRERTQLILETFLRQIGEALGRREMVRLMRFGIFYVWHRPPTPGRNPRTGAIRDNAAVDRPKFRASQELRQLVRRLDADPNDNTL
jgi:DNA-binding protein HU-beta